MTTETKTESAGKFRSRSRIIRLREFAKPDTELTKVSELLFEVNCRADGASQVAQLAAFFFTSSDIEFTFRFAMAR